MLILSLNFGSSSIKYRLFDSKKNFRLIMKGVAERIGQKNSSISFKKEGEKESKKKVFFKDHKDGLKVIYKTISDCKEIYGKIKAVGHRVVHGGEKLRKPTLINSKVIKQIKNASLFAPLHSHPAIIGIELTQKLFPHIPHVAIFDTGAFESMPHEAFLYGIPFEFYEKHHIRRFGFHGINHSYVAKEASKIVSKPLKQLKIISCHLGSGCSISAFSHGVAIENSMGLTPLEGLMMSSRSGDVDPSLVLYFIETLGMKPQEVGEMLNKKSGLLGLSGYSDIRDVIESAKNGRILSQIALDLFIYRIQKCIGGYIAILNGVDVIIFTGGIGENSALVRKLVLEKFGYMNAVLDKKKNEKNANMFSSKNSSVVLLNIPANEELAIAKQTYEVLE